MTLAGCNKATADTDIINAKAKAALSQKYPDATNVKWNTKNGYAVAKFNNPSGTAHGSGYDYSVWLDRNGKWFMTESEIRYDALPEAVKTAFTASEYAQWRIDDIDKLERPEMETFYVIEVETREGNVEKEADLYYSESGVLIKVVLDEDADYDYEDYLPSDLQATVAGVIEGLYPGAVIVDVEYEKGGIEVEIVHERRGKDVYLTKDHNWIKTEWDVRRNELPDAVKSQISTSWAGWKIDDAEYVETPSGSWYKIELEKGESEVKVRIAPDGTILQ